MILHIISKIISQDDFKLIANTNQQLPSHILLIQDGVYNLLFIENNIIPRLSALEDDIIARGLATYQHLATTVNYNGFVDLILKANHTCNCW